MTCRIVEAIQTVELTEIGLQNPVALVDDTPPIRQENQSPRFVNFQYNDNIFNQIFYYVDY